MDEHVQTLEVRCCNEALTLKGTVSKLTATSAAENYKVLFNVLRRTPNKKRGGGDILSFPRVFKVTFS